MLGGRTSGRELWSCLNTMKRRILIDKSAEADITAKRRIKNDSEAQRRM